MLTIGLHEIENIVYYKKAAFDFSYQGLSVIYGRNVNAGERSSNGAGKSLILKTVPKIFNIGAPVDQAKLRRSPLFRKGSRIRTQLRDDIAQYTIEMHQKAESGGIKTTLAVDGDDRRVRTESLVEKQIENIFSLTEDEFYTYVYLDSRRLAKFQLGTNANRFEFFTNLFQLNRFDSIREVINSIISQAKEDRVRHGTLSTQIEDLQKNIKQLDVDDCRRQIQELDALSQQLQQQVLIDERLMAAVRVINFEDLQYVCKALRLEKPEQLLTDNRLSFEIAEIGADLDAMRDDLQLAREWERYRPRREQWDRLMAPFKDYDPKEFLVDEQRLDRLEQDLEQKQRSWRSLGVLKEVVLSEDFEPSDATPEELQRCKDGVAEARSRLNQINKDIEEIEGLLRHDHGGQNCPMCGTSGVSIKEYLMRRLKQLDTDANMQINVGRRLKAMAENLEQYLEYQTWKTQRDSLKAEVDALIDQVEPLLEARKKYRAYQEVVRQKPEEPQESAPDASAEQLQSSITKLEALRSKLEHLQRCSSQLQQVLESLGSSPSADQIDAIARRSRENQQLLADKQRLSREIGSSIAVFERDNARLQELQEQRDAINLEDAIIMSEFHYAYSNKGLKGVAIRLLTERLEDRMNRWQHLVYREPMRFRFEVTESEFTIMVKRGDGTESDIREMSGAESRAFSYLFPLACLPSVPSNRRVNIMILDEPEVNLDEPAKELFLSQYLPQLRRIIPHVIIATPLETEFPDARRFYARKVGNTTTLEPA